MPAIEESLRDAERFRMRLEMSCWAVPCCRAETPEGRVWQG